MRCRLWSSPCLLHMRLGPAQEQGPAEFCQGSRPRPQALVSRETGPMDTAVVSVTRLAAGEGAYNVIPEHASFGGTIRSLSHDHLMLLRRRVTEARGLPSRAACAAAPSRRSNEPALS